MLNLEHLTLNIAYYTLYIQYFLLTDSTTVSNFLQDISHWTFNIKNYITSSIIYWQYLCYTLNKKRVKKMLFKLLQKKLFVTSTCHYLLYYFSGRPVLTNLLSINRPTKLLSKLKHQWSLYFATFGLNHTNIGSERLFGHCTKKRRK